MITHPNKLLYIGAGYHIEPVTHFKHTKTFVFIDSQPRSDIYTIQPKFNTHDYKPYFVNDIISICQHYGFNFDTYSILDKRYYKQIISKKWFYTSWFFKIPKDINPTMLVFINKKTQQTLIYYISTNIKFNMNKTLENDIATCDGIMVSQYFPEIDILRYFVRPKKFFGYTDTCYSIKKENLKEEDNHIIYFLHNCVSNIPYYFTDFFIVFNETGHIIRCTDFKHFFECNKEYINQKTTQLHNEDT